MMSSFGPSRLRRTPTGAAPFVGGFFLAAALMIVPQHAAANCAAPAGDLQAELCASAPLSDAWSRIEAELARITAAQPDLGAALAEDQALFASLMEKTVQALKAEHPADQVGGIAMAGLEERLDFLRSVDLGQGTGLEGGWQNAAGQMQVGAQGPEGRRVQISVMEPIMGLNTCVLDAIGTEAADLLVVELPSSDEVGISRMGQSALAGVDFTRAGRAAQGPADCMDSPPISGWYFRVTTGA